MFLVSAPAIAGAQTSLGEQKFTAVCSACHTIGEGVRVGPDLKGVHDRRSEEWLLKFIPSPQKMIDSGDPAAVELHKKFPVTMPDQTLSASEIKAVLAYIKAGGGGEQAEAPPERAATPENIRRGQEHFQGIRRFTNGGPACNSCHHVQNDAVIGGGVLAKDLTAAFGRMGSPGLHAILGQPPFPVMEAAYQDKPLTSDEVFDLVAFLQDADQHQLLQQPRDYGFKLAYSGGIGFLLLMGLYGLFGRRRKKLPVNHEIFERQIKSQ